MFSSSDIYYMAFDQLWGYCQRNSRNYEELSNIISLLNGYGKFECFALFNSSYLPSRVSFADIIFAFKAYLTCIEGDFSKNQTYIQGKVSFDDRTYNLTSHWEEEYEDIRVHNTTQWRDILKQVVKAQSSNFCQQLAKFGLVFLTPSQSSFTSRQYKALKYLYDYSDILLNV